MKVLVGDNYSHRIMKWKSGETQGAAIAGQVGQEKTEKDGRGNQFTDPTISVVGDEQSVYVTDRENDCLLKGRKDAMGDLMLVDGNGNESRRNQLNAHINLSFDTDQNLYVSDMANNRIQKFDLAIFKKKSFHYATTQINRHVATFLLLFGTLGNLLNIYVLNEHSFHENPCSIYLSWSSITSSIFIWSGFLTRVLQGYNINWPNQNSIACKTRQLLLNVTWPMGIWCLVGASIDRYLCSHSSARYRLFSTNLIAKRFALAIFIFFCCLFVEVLYCFEGSIPNVPVLCYGQNIPCRLFNDWAALSFDIILPSFFLAVFGALTIRNIRQRSVRPVIDSEVRSNRRSTMRANDRNLTRMLLIQVLFILVLDLPFGIYRPYASLTSNIPKSSYRAAVENLTYSVIVLLICVTHSTSFYLYTLTGSVYRRAFKQIGQRWLNRIRLIHQ
ncbi:unnamed protein product [Adineta ricciae]|uniref:G-protein coupled receptors family 1 profile domain-containing protein n=1 Tax=Adineta ricciae TaxID=249248 RepID=A0A815NFJ8_ADIRI|nr:unnamed protein product [Adineta ricciae]CAF1590056.1 unnamed protein product [Adineta ricciae]